jgi:hypothetical protein
LLRSEQAQSENKDGQVGDEQVEKNVGIHQISPSVLDLFLSSPSCLK